MPVRRRRNRDCHRGPIAGAEIDGREIVGRHRRSPVAPAANRPAPLAATRVQRARPREIIARRWAHQTSSVRAAVQG
jgi:hypothetical protein